MKKMSVFLLFVACLFAFSPALHAQRADSCVSLTTHEDEGNKYFTVVNNCSYKLHLTWVSRDVVPTKHGYNFSGTEYLRANGSKPTFFKVEYGIHVYACKDPSYPSTMDDRAIFAPTDGYKCNQ